MTVRNRAHLPPGHRTAESPGGAHRSPRPLHARSRPPGPRSHEDSRHRARDRFLHLDAYRVEREWRRYEGTPQRELFRELRARFLERHRSPGGWALDIGPGPGRFTPLVGAAGTRRVLLDLSPEMLREASRRLRAASPAEERPDLVRGDAAHPPFKTERFDEVVVLGNTIGFAESEAGRVLDEAARLLRTGGTLVAETVADTGERSRYLARLPPGAVRRLLAAPINAVRPRVEREGFRPEPPSPKASAFRRVGEGEARERLGRGNVEITELMAVAPALGNDPERLAAARLEPIAWRHLLELEEVLGRTAPRRARAAALLVGGRKTEGVPTGRTPPS